MKKIVDGRGLQQKMLLREKSKLLPVTRKKELLCFMSLLELFFLTAFDFLNREVIPDFQWVKHK